jgi:hypothetical protein
MLLHLFKDEKFIDIAHEVFEAAAPGQSRYICVGDASQLFYIRTFNPEIWSLHCLLQSTADFPNYAAVILHSLNYQNRRIVVAAPRATQFVWIGWGGDYHHLIGDDYFLSQTAAIVKRTARRKVPAKLLKKTIALATNPSRIPSSIMERRNESNFHRAYGIRGQREFELFERIRYFCPVLELEYQLIRERHPDFHPEYFCWNYSIPAFDEITRRPPPLSTDGNLRVLVGQCAKPSCNHIEAFERLASHALASKLEIVCPLSYGDHYYKNAIIERGNQLFGDRFKPIEHFMPADEYWSILSSCTAAVMNHTQQLAGGNILYMLLNGATVVLNPRSPFYQELRNMGIDVHSIEELDDVLQVDRKTCDKSLQRRRDILSARFSPQSIIQRTSKLLDKLGVNRSADRSPAQTTSTLTS